MNKKHSLLVLLLAALSGCGSKKQKPAPSKHRNTNLAYNQEDNSLDIPLAQDELAMSELDVANFFDQDVEEFITLSETEETYESLDGSQGLDSKELAWQTSAVEDSFPVVYFDFDRHSVKDDQKNVIAHTAEQTRNIVNEMAKEGKHPVIVIEGHACHSAGSAVYNLALSERRAKAVADWFVQAGVDRDNVKIVGRGQEVPAIIDGKQVDGSREEQWPNRRVEVHVIYS